MRKYWTDAMNVYFEKLFPYCVLIFKYNKIYVNRQKNKRTFYSVAVCKQSNCTQFKFFSFNNLKSCNDKYMYLY